MYDLAFFVWCTVLLFNIIAGLMLDSFAAIREEKNIRQETLDNECFICGLTRSVFDDNKTNKGIISSGADRPTFDRHKDKEHDLWMYVQCWAPPHYRGDDDNDHRHRCLRQHHA